MVGTGVDPLGAILTLLMVPSNHVYKFRPTKKNVISRDVIRTSTVGEIERLCLLV